MAQWKPDIFAHLDYRAYLKAYYDAAKANLPQFSYRYFSRRAGFASSNFLKLVIDGQRNPSADSVDKIAGAIGLSADEHRFFAHLVAFDQARDAEERAHHLEQLTAMRRFWDARPIDGMLFEYLSHWYNVAIRELAAGADFRDDPAWIAARLHPPITPGQARAALTLLLDLGLLERTADGRVVQAEVTLDAGHEVRAVGARRFHRQMIERGREALDTVGPDRRDISGMTVCVRADRVEELKRRLRAFREQLMAFCDEQADPDTVYQINMQLFPLTTAPGDDP